MRENMHIYVVLSVLIWLNGAIFFPKTLHTVKLILFGTNVSRFSFTQLEMDNLFTYKLGLMR